MTLIACFSSRSPRAAGVACLLLLAACGGTVERAAGGTTTGGTTTTASSSAATSSSGGAGTPAAQVRFANLAASSPGPFDVCADAGPEAGLLAAQGLTLGLGFGEVSSYLAPVPGAAWRLVTPGSPCSEATSVPLAIDWPPGSEGARVTVVPRPSSWGVWAGAYAFVDEPVNDQYGVNLRALDFLGLGPSGSSKTTMTVLQQGAGDPQAAVLFSELAFASVPTLSASGTVTSAGFVHTPYVSVGELVVVPNAYLGPLTFPGDVPIPGGEGNAYGVGSIFLAGAIGDGSARAVVCDDNSPAQGALSSCTVRAPMK